jgi:hypothetical protein
MFPTRRYITAFGAMAFLAIVARVLWEIPSWASLLVLLIAWPLIGTLITVDDDLPGGWSNPDGTVIPEWKTLWWWADLLLVRGSLVVIAIATEEALDGGFVPWLWFAGALMMAVGLPILIRGIRRGIVRAG